MSDDLSYLQDDVEASVQPEEVQSFAAVPEEEIAFAMSLFVSAGNGDLAGSLQEGVPARSLEACTRLLWVISRGIGGMMRDEPERPYLSRLEGAFRTVWRHYEGDERQASVCARVLGFYYLMERSGGAIVENWVSACEGSDELVVLHPAVVATVACAPLGRDGVLSREGFLAGLAAYVV